MHTKGNAFRGADRRNTTVGYGTNRKNILASYHDMVSAFFDMGNSKMESMFLLAARDGDLSQLERMLHERRDASAFSIDARDPSSGNTALIWAAKRGHGQIGQLLLHHGVDATARNHDGHTAIEVASPRIRHMIVKSVEAGGCHRNLMQAAWQGNAKLIHKILAETRIDIDCRNADGLTPLLLVTRDLHLFDKLDSKLTTDYNPSQVISELLIHRADPNACDSDGRTPLHYISSSKVIQACQLVQQLIRNGSNVDARDLRCFSPLHFACQSGDVSVSEALLDADTDVNGRGFAGATPLHVCALNGHDSLISCLLHHGADITLVDDCGLTAVDVAKTKRVRATLRHAWANATRPVCVEGSEEERGEVGAEDKQLPVSESYAADPPTRLARSCDVLRSLPATTVSSINRFSANSLVPRGQLTEKSRRTEKELVRDVADGKYGSGAAPFTRCRPSGSPTRSSIGGSKAGLRLSPLKTPRDAHQVEKRPAACRKTSACTAGSTVKRPGAATLQKCPSDPIRLPSARKEYYTPSVAVLGLNEDTGDVKWTRMLPMPLRQGHARHHSDPASSAPCLSDVRGSDELCLRGRSPSRNAALSSSEEYDADPMTPGTSGGVTLSSSPPNRLTPLLPSGDRNVRRIPHMKKEDKRSTTPRMPCILDFEHQSGTRMPAPTGSHKFPTPHSSPRAPSKLAHISTSDLTTELPRLSDDDLRSSLAETNKISHSNDSGVGADKVTQSQESNLKTKNTKDETKAANVACRAKEMTDAPTEKLTQSPPGVSSEVKDHRTAVQTVGRIADRDSGVYSDASPIQETQEKSVSKPKPKRPPPPKIATNVKAKPSAQSRNPTSPHVQTKSTMQNLAKQRRAKTPAAKPVARAQPETVKSKVPSSGMFETKRPMENKEVVVKQTCKSDVAKGNEPPQVPPRIKSQLRKAASHPITSGVVRNEPKVADLSQKGVARMVASETLVKTSLTMAVASSGKMQAAMKASEQELKVDLEDDVAAVQNSSHAASTTHQQNSPITLQTSSKNGDMLRKTNPIPSTTRQPNSPLVGTTHQENIPTTIGGTYQKNVSPAASATRQKNSPAHSSNNSPTNGSGNNSPTAGRRSSSPLLLLDCLLSKIGPRLGSMFRRPSSEDDDRQSKLSTVHPEVCASPAHPMVEYTGPVIQDAFESINRRQADQIRQMIAEEEKAKVRLSTARKRSESRPISSKRAAAAAKSTKPQMEDAKPRRTKTTKKKIRKKKKVVEEVEDEEEAEDIACDERTDVIVVQGLGDDGSSEDDDSPAYVPSPRHITNKRSPRSLPGQIHVLSNESAEEEEEDNIEWCSDQIAAEIVFDDVVFDESNSNPSTPRSRRTSVNEPDVKASPRAASIRRGSLDSPRSPCRSPLTASPRDVSGDVRKGLLDCPRRCSHDGSLQEITNRVHRSSIDSPDSCHSNDSLREKCKADGNLEKIANVLSHPFDSVHPLSSGSHPHKFLSCESTRRMRHGSAECPSNRRTEELLKESRHVRHGSVDSQCARIPSQNASLQDSFDAAQAQRHQYEKCSKRSTDVKASATFITQRVDSPDNRSTPAPKSVKSCVVKRDEAEINEMIEEILNSTPHPSLNMSLRSESSNHDHRPHAPSRQRERTFQQIAASNASPDDNVFSADDKTLTPDNSSSRDHLEMAQLTKLMNTLKNLQLRVDEDTAAPPEPVIASKPPAPPAASASRSAGRTATTKPDRTLERSPRFIRKHDSFREIKQPTEGVEERNTLTSSSHPAGTDFSLGSLPLPDSTAHDSLHAQPATRSLSRSSSESTADDGELIQWRRGNMLGKGAYGTVWCGLTSQGKQVAVKQIELPIENLERAEREYEKVQQEVELLKTLQHVNIVAYLGTSLEDNIVSIFMVNVAGGSIANLIGRFGALDEEVFCRYTTQMLAGIEYLHGNNVIHRDIKGGNVMVNQDGVVKLIDFGCAKRLCINMGLDGSLRRILTSMKGTPYWMAPEVVMETGHGTKSDIWSVGCTVFEMSTKKPPWSEMPPMSAILAIGTPNKPIPQLPTKFSAEARDFVAKCLSRDPNLRPCATTLRSHPFITRRRNKK